MITTVADRPLLGTLRFVDAETGLDVGRSLCVTVAGASISRDRQGTVLVERIAEAQARNRPPEGGAGPLGGLVEDPSGRYLPRRFALPTPAKTGRTAGDQAAAAPPACIAMYLTPAARPTPGSAILRVRVTDAATHKGLGGALVRVTGRARGRLPRVIGRGLSDEHGDALVAMRWSPAAMGDGKPGRGALMPELEVEVTAAIEPGSSTQAPCPPNPDTLEHLLDHLAEHGAAPSTLAHVTVHQKICWGRESSVRVAIPAG